MSLHITVNEPTREVAVVSVEGEVDMSSSPEVRNALTPLLRPGRKAVVIDLSQVQYMDSSGIATMVEGLQHSMKQGIHFRLSALSPPVRDVFELARLTALFHIYPTTEEATSDL